MFAACVQRVSGCFCWSMCVRVCNSLPLSFCVPPPTAVRTSPALLCFPSHLLAWDVYCFDTSLLSSAHLNFHSAQSDWCCTRTDWVMPVSPSDCIPPLCIEPHSDMIQLASYSFAFSPYWTWIDALPLELSLYSICPLFFIFSFPFLPQFFIQLPFCSFFDPMHPSPLPSPSSFCVAKEKEWENSSRPIQQLSQPQGFGGRRHGRGGHRKRAALPTAAAPTPAQPSRAHPQLPPPPPWAQLEQTSSPADPSHRAQEIHEVRPFQPLWAAVGQSTHPSSCHRPLINWKSLGVKQIKHSSCSDSEQAWVKPWISSFRGRFCK